jgi:hypothetical protein
MKIYTSTGLVFGNYWGGGQGAYKAENLEAQSKEELISKAEEMIKNGSLDSGMGYESLLGAILNITETEVITKNGKEYRHEESETEMIGDLTENQQDFLMDGLYSI